MRRGILHQPAMAKSSATLQKLYTQFGTSQAAVANDLYSLCNFCTLNTSARCLCNCTTHRPLCAIMTRVTERCAHGLQSAVCCLSLMGPLASWLGMDRSVLIRHACAGTAHYADIQRPCSAVLAGILTSLVLSLWPFLPGSILRGNCPSTETNKETKVRWTETSRDRQTE